MARIRVTKGFDWEMAHALDHHDGKCHNIHGHTYSLDVTFIGEVADAPGTPKDGMVVDFADIKRIVKTHIVDVYDHALVLRDNSRFLSTLDAEINPRLMLTPYQPPCENLLIDMVDVIRQKLNELSGVELHSARLRETKTSYAEWYAEDH
jgi:6-pyruvoyltetrahydropterin/6-carboxytetrahydropterin synthase